MDWKFPSCRDSWRLKCLAVACAMLSGCATESMRLPSLFEWPSYRPSYYRPSYVAPGQPRVVRASWYGPSFQGRRTASGEIFNEHRLTAASRDLPIGERVKVTNLHNGRSVVVRINDRGPYVYGRSIDLSKGAAQRLHMTRAGVAPVRITPLGNARASHAWTRSRRSRHRRRKIRRRRRLRRDSVDSAF